MQQSLAYRIELYFYDAIILILGQSARARNAFQKSVGKLRKGEWVLLGGALLASVLAGLATGYALYFLVGNVG